MVDDCCPAIWESDTRQGSRPRPTTISLVSHRNSILQLYFRFSKMFNLKFYLMDPNSPHFCKSRAFPMMWLHFALHNKLCPFRTLVCLFPFSSPFKDFSGRTVSKLSQAALLNAPSLHCRHVTVSIISHHHRHHHPPLKNGLTVDVNCQSCKFINIRAGIDKNSSNQGFTLLGLPGCLLALAAS